MADLESPIVLDTDVASLAMRGRLDPATHPLYRHHTWCVSFVTVGELAKGVTAAGWGIRHWTRLADWLRGVLILPFDVRVSYTWGQLAGAAQRRGRPQPINDMWIAAVSLAHDLPLATRNVKDFAAFVEHHDLVLVTE